MLRVTLAGHAAVWWFPGGAALHDWLASCPWLADGGARAVRVSDGATVAPWFESLRRAVRACDDGVSGARAILAPRPNGSADLVAWVCDALEVTQSVTRPQTLRRLADVLRHRPAVLALDLTDVPGVPAAFLDAADDLCEALRKQENIGLVLVTVARSGGVRGAWDFSRGEPLEGPLRVADPGRA